jgi:hypothetical protein
MDWTRSFESLQQSFNDLRSGENFSTQELTDAVSRIVALQPVELSMETEQQDTLYRLGWWIALADILFQEFSLLERLESKPEAFNFDELFEQLDELAQTLQTNEVDRDLVETAETVHSESGQVLRAQIESLHTADPGVENSGFESMAEQMMNHITDLKADIEEVVEAFHQDRGEDAEQILPKLVQGIERVAKALIGHSSAMNQRGVEVSPSRINGMLTDLVSALEGGDFVAFPDLLQHEVQPLFSNYQSRLKCLVGESEHKEGLFEKNLEALSADPKVVERIRAADIERTNAVIGTDRVGGDSLSITRDGTRYQLTSQYNAVSDAQRWAEIQGEKMKHSRVVAFGFGLGVRLRELLTQLSDSTQLFVIEPDPNLLKLVLTFRDCTDILGNSRVTLFTGAEREAFNKAFGAWLDWVEVSELGLLELPNYGVIFPEPYEDFVEAVQVQAETKGESSKQAFYAQSVHWVQNILTNIPALFDASLIEPLEGRFEGKPAVIVSAGPSLDENIEDLKAQQDRVLVLAIDSVVSVLREHDIEPDLIVTADSLEPNWKRNLKGSGFEEIPLVAWLRSYPDILETHADQLYFVSDGTDLGVTLETVMDAADVDVEDEDTAGFGSSVSHAAYEVAKLLGAEPIVLIGQDLTFKEDGRDYASGVERGEINPDYSAEGIDGEPRETTKEWYTFMLEFQQIIEDEDFVIDATEGGLKIPGTEIQALEKTLDEYGEEDFEPKRYLEEAWDAASPVLTSAAEARQISEELEAILDEVDTFQQKFDRALQLCRELENLHADGTDYSTTARQERSQKILAELDSIDQAFDQSDRMNLFFLPTYSIIDQIKNAYREGGSTDENEDSPKEVAKTTRRMYEEFSEVLNQLRPDIEAGQRELSEMASEEDK